jgi:hypothetical protein
LWLTNKFSSRTDEAHYTGARPKMNSQQLLNTEVDLLKFTRDLLKAAPRQFSINDIANATKLEPGWISAFKNEKMKDPGFNKVRALHNFLVNLKTSGVVNAW